MKQFRKNEQGLFICEECEKTFYKFDGLSKHIGLKHIDKQKYYDKWIKENDDNICLVCKNKTIFFSIRHGYKHFCCKIHENEYNHKKRKEALVIKYGVEYTWQIKGIKEKSKQTCLKNYGVECSLQSQEIREKGKETCKEKYGVEYALQSKEIRNKGKKTKKEKYGNEEYNNRPKMKQTKKEKYGNENYNNHEKYKETCQEKWGVDNVYQSEEIKEKCKQIFIKKYGVENPSQNKEVHEKQFKSGYKIKQFKNTDIWYQGSFERDFLNKHHDKFPDIINAPIIKYTFNEKEHHYFPDFFIPFLNLIVEIKSSWIIEKQGITFIKTKEKATISNGFNYILIINKNYNEFNQSFNVGIL